MDFYPVRAKIEAKKQGRDSERAAMCAISGITDQQLDELPNGKFKQLATTAALFPDNLGESKLGMIPKGWKISSIGKEVSIYGGATPSTKNQIFWDGGQNYWATPKDLSQNDSMVLIDTLRNITDEGVAKISSGKLPINTVLLSSRAPVGYLAIAKIPISINQGFIAMVSDKKLPHTYVLQWTRSHLDIIKQRASGSTFAEISKKNFRSIDILVPHDAILSHYKNMCSHIYDAIAENMKESKLLTLLREALLPKLLSGAIKIDGHMDGQSQGTK